MASLVSRTISKTPLPSRLPLLLVGAGLANLTLARTLQIHGYSDPDRHFRIFDSASPHKRTRHALNLQRWATDPLDALLRRGKPHYGNQPGLFQSCTVDAHHGGSGYVNTKINLLRTSSPITDLNDDDGAGSVRYKKQEVVDMIKGGINVESRMEFLRFEEVVDAEGRTAVRAFFKDGTEVLGSAIVGGDGLRSKVRSSLLPTITPKVLPLVVYTGEENLLSRMMVGNIDEDDTLPAYNKKNPAEVDCSSVYVGDGVTFVFSKTYLDWENARIQWTYIRKPKGFVEEERELVGEDGEVTKDLVTSVEEGVEDKLYRPNRKVTEAEVIPEEFYQEIEVLKSGSDVSQELINYIQDIREPVKTTKAERKASLAELTSKPPTYNWLMRSVKLPETKEELDQLKSKVPGGDRVFLIGDAAHAAPIVQGCSGSHSLVDGFELGTLLAKAFRTLALPPTTSTSSSSPVLEALNTFESTETLTRWRVACVDKSETELMSLVQPKAVWEAIQKAEGSSELTKEQKELRKDPRVDRALEELAEWHTEQTKKTQKETEEKERRRKQEIEV